jgi:hypothetical protein
MPRTNMGLLKEGRGWGRGDMRGCIKETAGMSNNGGLPSLNPGPMTTGGGGGPIGLGGNGPIGLEG